MRSWDARKRRVLLEEIYTISLTIPESEQEKKEKEVVAYARCAEKLSQKVKSLTEELNKVKNDDTGYDTTTNANIFFCRPFNTQQCKKPYFQDNSAAQRYIFPPIP